MYEFLDNLTIFMLLGGSIAIFIFTLVAGIFYIIKKDKKIEEIAEYIPEYKRICISDRKEAIKYAIDIAQSGDILLFAGKGHEEYQLINGKKLPFSEEAIIKECFKEADKMILR